MRTSERHTDACAGLSNNRRCRSSYVIHVLWDAVSVGVGTGRRDWGYSNQFLHSITVMFYGHVLRPRWSNSTGGGVESSVLSKRTISLPGLNCPLAHVEAG